MREYIYIDRGRIERLADQLGGRRETAHTSTTQLHLKVFNYERTTSTGPETEHSQVERVMEALRAEGSLDGLRPFRDPSHKPFKSVSEDYSDRMGRYVYEVMAARKVLIPAPKGRKKLPDLAVWVSEPDQTLIEADAALVEHSWDCLRPSSTVGGTRRPEISLS